MFGNKSDEANDYTALALQPCEPLALLAPERQHFVLFLLFAETDDRVTGEQRGGDQYG